MEHKKKFELEDEQLDDIVGGVDIGMSATNIRFAKWKCPLSGDNRGMLISIFGKQGLYCSCDQHQAMYDAGASVSCGEVNISEPYTVGW